jgi:hypothetical protein
MENRRRRLLAAAVIVCVGVLVPAPPVTAARGADDPPPVLATATAAGLVKAFTDGQSAVDDSSGTACMVTDPVTHAPPEAVAYRTDRIAIRTWEPESVVRTQLRAALNASGGAGVGIGAVEKADFPGLEDTVEPVLYVELHTGGEPAPVVRTARKLWNPPLTTAAPVYLASFAGDETDHGPLESWPNGPPRPTTDSPPDRADDLGAGVTIAVYDMGMPDPAQAVWAPHVLRLSAGDVEQIDAREPFGIADYTWTGHDVAIASVIDTVAPGATIEAVRMTEPSGVPTEESAARRMAKTLSAAHSHVKSPPLAIAAFGTPGCLIDPRHPELGDLVPLGLEMVTDAVDLYRETTILASAGNRASPRRYYPAAFPKQTILSVGALDTGGSWTSPSRSGVPADFSNYGSTVEVWAPGVGLVARHVIGVRFEPDGELINGWATVDGTSYSGPYVAALLAVQMAANPGTTALEAWDAIAQGGVHCSATIGGGLAVALTTLDASPSTPPTAGQPPLC